MNCFCSTGAADRLSELLSDSQIKCMQATISVICNHVKIIAKASGNTDSNRLKAEEAKSP